MFLYAKCTLLLGHQHFNVFNYLDQIFFGGLNVFFFSVLLGEFEALCLDVSVTFVPPTTDATTAVPVTQVPRGRTPGPYIYIHVSGSHECQK